MNNQHEEIAEKLLPGVRRYLGSKLGDRGEEVAGEVLNEVLTGWTGEGDAADFVFKRVGRAALMVIRRDFGLPGAWRDRLFAQGEDCTESLANLVSRDPQPDHAAMQQAEFYEGLLTIEAIAEPTRRDKALLWFLSDVPAICTTRPLALGLTLRSMEEMLDALMLGGGASLEFRTKNSGQPTLSLRRRRQYWRALAWQRAVCSAHGVELSLASGEEQCQVELLYRTRGNLQKLFGQAYTRWADGLLPSGLNLTMPVVAHWLLAAVLKSPHAGRPLLLSAGLLHLRPEEAERIACEVENITSTPTRLVEWKGRRNLLIDAAHRSKVETFLTECGIPWQFIIGATDDPKHATTAFCNADFPPLTRQEDREVAEEQEAIEREQAAAYEDDEIEAGYTVESPAVESPAEAEVIAVEAPAPESAVELPLRMDADGLIVAAAGRRQVTETVMEVGRARLAELTAAGITDRRTLLLKIRRSIRFAVEQR